MNPLVIARLGVRDVRNLEAVEIEPSGRFNVVHGDNGQGKTNLIEAIYLVATSQSFRTKRTAEIVRRGVTQGSVRVTLDDGGITREQSVGLGEGIRVLRIDGTRPRSAALYAGRTPVVVFSPSSLALTMGSSRERRTLLDRVALYAEPSSLVEVISYQRALRERQRALEERGVHARDLDDWEQVVVQHGIEVMRARQSAADSVLAATRDVFHRIAELVCEGSYVPSAPAQTEAYLAALVRSRPKDLARRSASIGPHRDDVEFEIAGMPVRTTASQGQHRALVLALKAAELAVIGRTRGVHPLLLLDDVSSELDVARTSALFEFLASQRGQVFLTTTRPELISLDKDRHGRVDFRIVAGRVIP